jgi:hypothetical protein
MTTFGSQRELIVSLTALGGTMELQRRNPVQTVMAVARSVADLQQGSVQNAALGLYYNQMGRRVTPPAHLTSTIPTQPHVAAGRATSTVNAAQVAKTLNAQSVKPGTTYNPPPPHV